MLKLDHLRLPVPDLARSQHWYGEALGMTVEFEVPAHRMVALQDSEGFTIFLQEAAAAGGPSGCVLWFQVDDVDAPFVAWRARGVEFGHGPQKSHWGYGAELIDPDGYPIRLWDERSMKAN
jgi:catechol 2,3-dioxygenase-like lactoylglutathione lyase family enzyme